ncbi:MAG TPA: hypothetical protein VKX16_18705 [Chloroflexota bacterium]|nr:hypothetical protein [Chloroflexota bacterium]
MPIADSTKDLGYLLENWGSFVREVETGYDDGIHEYLNDLSVRQILERVLRALPSDSRDDLVALLRPFGEAFIAATVSIDRHLGTGVVNPDNPPSPQDRPDLAVEWFYTRIPRNPSEELVSDLKDSGL